MRRYIIIIQRCTDNVMKDTSIISDDVKMHPLKVKLRNVKEKLFIKVYVC